MAWCVDDRRLVISFSIQDLHQYLAVVSAEDIRSTLLDIAEFEHASEEAVCAGRAKLDLLIA
jgi:hypothetical protein